MSLPETISTTEAVAVDYIAMRAWHFRCSIDKARPPEMRRWHRNVVASLSLKLSKLPKPGLLPMKIAVIEILTDTYRNELQRSSGNYSAFDWQKFCSSAITSLTTGEIK